VRFIGELLLWFAAGLTIKTGYDYLRAGLVHMQDDAPAMKAAKPSRVT
jgi:cardiolipin synthase (CMP-forming)